MNIYLAIKAIQQDPPTDLGIISINRLTKLAKISRRAYYYWLNGGRKKSDTNDELNELLLSRIKIFFEKSHQTKGYLSMTAEINIWLKQMRLPPVNHKRIQRLMRQAGLRSVIRRKSPKEKNNTSAYIADNHLNREFNRSGINEVWVTDSTLIHYGIHNERRIWLCGVLDLYSNELLGWSLSNEKTTNAAIEAFEKAWKIFPDAKPLVHSDRGSAYTSYEFHEYLKARHITQSMSRPGKPHDNAVIESFWSQFKTEWLELSPTPLTSLNELKSYLIEGITYFSNHRRTHKNKGLTPIEVRLKSLNQMSRLT